MSLPKTQATATATSNYETVRKEIERNRLLPWASAVGVRIGDFTVSPLSFRSLIDLELSKNAFVSGDTPTLGDIAAYIWRHMPEYKPSASSKCFVKRIAEAEGEDLMLGVYQHMGIAFEETPASAQFGGYAKDNRLPALPSIASICSEYGSAYGMDPQDVADIDLRIVFQCCRALRIQNGEKYSEPKRLRAAKSQFLESHGKN